MLGAKRGSGGARNREERPGVVMHTCNPGVGEGEAGGRIRFLARPLLHSQINPSLSFTTLAQKDKQKQGGNKDPGMTSFPVTV